MIRLAALVRVLRLVVVFAMATGLCGSFPAATRRVTSTAMQQGKPIRSRALEAFGRLPLRFEENRGQADSSVGFIARLPGRSFLVHPAGVEVRGVSRERGRSCSSLRLRFTGASRDVRLEGLDLMEGKSHYFLGNDPSNWHTGVGNFAQVRARNLYPGVDVVYYGNARDLEFDFSVAPHADASVVRLAIDGADGLAEDTEGNLRVRHGSCAAVMRAPRAFQADGSKRQEVSARYALPAPRLVTLKVGAYNPSRTLIIDPVLSYSTHLGGGGELGRAIAIDAEGNACVAGETPSLQFPTKTPAQSSLGGLVDAFVTKIRADGSGLLYSTYLGGSGEDRAAAIAVDLFGNAYVCGNTRSSDFPTRSSYQSRFAGGPFGDAFLAKLGADGSRLVYSTYLGGSDDDFADGIAVDSSGSACVVGTTRSTNFPTRRPLQASFGGLADAIVAKLSADGSQLLFSTYLGGADTDNGRGIALDTSGNACVTGVTFSANFPLRRALQSAFSGGSSSFVTKLSTSGGGYVYSTYLGAGEGNAVTMDAAGNAYVTGQAPSSTFPVVKAFQPGYGGGVSDAFASKINAAGSSILYSTYLGGSSSDIGYAIAADPAGNAYVTGTTYSSDFPAKDPLQPALRGPQDAFVSQIGPSGTTLLFSSWIGGSGNDLGYGVSVDRTGNVLLTGVTSSVDFPVARAIKPTITGFLDAFVTRIAPDQPARNFLYFPQVVTGGGYITSFTLINTGSTTTTGTLALTDSQGRPWNNIFFAGSERRADSAPKGLVLGSSTELTLNPGVSTTVNVSALSSSDRSRTGWAFFESAGGLASGVATFLKAGPGSLVTSVGVLASPPVQYAMIVVDNDDSRERFTGFAVANPGGEAVSITLVTLDETGRIVDTVYPAALNPLVGGTQVATFLHEMIPARLKFRGSMVLVADGGKPFVVVALIQNRKLLTAIPVSPTKPPGI